MKKALKVLAVVTIIAILGSMLVACGKTNTDSAASVAPSDAGAASPSTAPAVKLKTLTYFTGNDTWAQAWKDAMANYTAANPNVTFDDQSVPAANDQFKTKINTDFAAGNEPDVCFGFTGVGDQKAMVDAGKVISWDDELKNDAAWGANFNTAALDGVRYSDGKVYGLPYLGYYEGMWYNEELFTKNSIKVPTNWTELLAAVDAFKAKNITPITVSFSEEPHYMIEAFILSVGGVDGHKALYDPSWEKGLDAIKELYKKGAFPKDVLTIKSQVATQLFLDEKAAMFISGSWSAGGFKDDKDGKFDVSSKSKFMAVPSLPDAKADPTDIIAGFGSGWFVAKSKGADNQAAATKFAKWLTTPDTIKTFVEFGGISAIKGVKPTKANPAQLSGIEGMDKAKHIDVPIDSRLKQEAWKTIWKGLSSLVTDKKTSKQLLDESQNLNK